MSKEQKYGLAGLLGFLASIVITVKIVRLFTDDEGMLMLSVALGFVLGFAWFSFMNSLLNRSVRKTSEKPKAYANDPYAALAGAAKAPGGNYPENVRDITLQDVRRKAREKRDEVYNSPDSDINEKVFADTTVTLFSKAKYLVEESEELFVNALEYIGYDKDIAEQLYKTLYERETKVYTLIDPDRLDRSVEK